jgi:hypothetical protein
MKRRSREIRQTVERSGAPEPGMAHAAGEWGEILRRDRDWFLLFFEFWLHAARDPRFGRRFRAVHREAQQSLAEGIAELLDELGLRPSLNPAELAQTVTVLGYGIALERLLDEKTIPDDLLGRVLELLLRGLQAEAEQGDP